MDPKTWREEQDLTLEKLAEKLGYKATSYISDVERGEKEPSGRLIRAYHNISKGAVSSADFQGAAINLVSDSAKAKRVSRIASIGPDMPRHQSQVSHEGFTACNGTAIPFLQIVRDINNTHSKAPCVVEIINNGKGGHVSG
jgi:transcriptional regulator with XRE-family HTH domain